MKFLLVDDDESIILFLDRLLAPFAQCESATSGSEALDRFKEQLDKHGKPYDVVFMDILMPEKDGHETVEEMRRTETQSKVKPADEFKLVMITCVDDVKDVSKAFFKGYASSYIVKPFDRDKVLGELKGNNII